MNASAPLDTSPQTSIPPCEGVFINRNFLLVWLGQTGSVFGDFVFNTTLVVWIAATLARSRTNHEIAEALVVSDETVKTHVGNILSKLQLAHRTQAVIYALKRGLISLDEIEEP